MRRQKLPIVLILMLTLTVTIMAPAAPVSASGLSDLLPQLASSTSGGSGNGVLNILIGLLLGNLFGNISPAGSSGSPKVLGASTAPADTASGEAIVATAKKYMGVPYVWGGDTPDGWDCSGFTQYVLKQNGITVPRTAAEQFATGTKVEKKDLQVGDLVFFTTYKPGASHVGFYLGDGRFIHASSSHKEVTISKLDEPYFAERYIGARRYTG